jgi:hypothetical protein
MNQKKGMSVQILKNNVTKNISELINDDAFQIN